MSYLLVTGTDTDVGKTWVAALLLRQLVARGIRVAAYKPACSGADFDAAGVPIWRDVDALAGAAKFTGDPHVICPQTFLAPLAPNLAAKLEGRRVNDALLVDAFHRTAEHADVAVVEGAGGLLSPLSDESTNADLAVRLNLPLIIVAANRLGVINHTLLTIEAARHRQLQILSVVLNDVAPRLSQPDEETSRSASGSSDSPPESSSASAIEHNAAELGRLLHDVPLFECRFEATHVTPMNVAAQQVKLPYAMS
ncbi:MAG: dethiobiotin synthase [Planctomycetaceae bacterium]